jgi:hypothetical protein
VALAADHTAENLDSNCAVLAVDYTHYSASRANNVVAVVVVVRRTEFVVVAERSSSRDTEGMSWHHHHHQHFLVGVDIHASLLSSSSFASLDSDIYCSAIFPPSSPPWEDLFENSVVVVVVVVAA